MRSCNAQRVFDTFDSPLNFLEKSFQSDVLLFYECAIMLNSLWSSFVVFLSFFYQLLQLLNFFIHIFFRFMTVLLQVRLCSVKSDLKILKIKHKFTLVFASMFITSIPKLFMSSFIAYIFVWEPLKFDEEGYSFGSYFNLIVMTLDRWDWEVVELYFRKVVVALKSSWLTELDRVLLSWGL
jgi:hypothetical protein